MSSVHSITVRLTSAQYQQLLTLCKTLDSSLSDAIRASIEAMSDKSAMSDIQGAQVGVCPKCGDAIAVRIPAGNIREVLLGILEAGSDEKMNEECSTCKRGLVSIESAARQLSEQSGRPVDGVIDEIERMARENDIDLISS